MALVGCISLVACGGTSEVASSTPDASTSSKEPDGGASGETIPSDDLGKSCGGGCAGSKICTVSDDGCAGGHCLFDGRTAPSEAYCTADCSNAACPSSYVCEDVPFELTRACVRDKSAPRDPSGQKIKGTVRLKGVAPLSADTASPFDVTYTIDGAPDTSSSPNRACGSVRITHAPFAKGFEIFIQACDASKPGEVLGLVRLEVPFRTGTFTATDADKTYPSITVGIGPYGGSTVAHYGDNRDATGATLDVTTVEGVEDAALPWKVGKMAFELGGPIEKGSCAGGACEPAAPTLDVAISLELVSVTSN